MIDNDTDTDPEIAERRAIELQGMERDRRARAFLWTLILVCTAIFLATEIAIYLHYPPR